ncbi:MAG: hypothetical protein A3F70_01130 [Acidobacteria bacterium RIFCSPLOWO2_12_FULL_67_14]|nr:MAG: hypothetical protein A3H29_12270 [Acidobacteria bacterium RIFCSPLOWO2_02_FULL_67_21]OFW38405.1 MAG: hypothetical protein A3F70_01130 [Acidobacteria bacterium RIFCSPLOWO2_12_FULL_67_14]
MTISPPDHPVRLLLVDDDVRFGEYVRVLLRRAQAAYELDVVHDVRGAMRELARNFYDVCLLDYRLGDEDGLDVVRQAQARDIHTPVILLTGEQDESLELTAIGQGAADYLNKSELDPHRLERALLRAIARHQLETALHDREQRLVEAEAFAHVMVAHITLEGTWLKMPRRLCELLGYSEEELRALRLADVTHPGDRLQHAKLRQQLRDGVVRSIEFEKRYIRKDGQLVWVYQNVSLVTGKDQKPLYFLAYLRDISDQKRAEEEQRQLEEQLRQAHKMEAVGQLAGGVAHDFNNLLTAILGYTGLLQDELAGMPDAARDLEEVHKAAKSASALTAQLLAFSRKQMLKAEVLSLNEVIEGMHNLLSRVLGEDITLVTRLGGDVPRVEADPVQLQQVLLNLAANARDAMPRGGRLVVETSGHLAEAAGAGGPSVPPGGSAVISVSDNGSGMDRETQMRVFEPFFTTKGQGKGTGLGLATVYGIVKQTGGDIMCETAPGEGTTFTIVLPATGKVLAAAGAPACHASRGTGTILVVEDRPDVRQVTRRILESRGYHVLDTADPDIALRTAEDKQIDLLLTDVVMPEMTGPELARRIRSRMPGLPILFMSGFTGHSALKEMDGAPFIRKPFSPDTLAQKIQEVMERSCTPPPEIGVA